LPNAFVTITLCPQPNIMYRNHLVAILKFLLFLGIGIGILFLVYKGQNTAFQADCNTKGILPENCSLARKVLKDFGLVNYWWMLLVFIAYLLSTLSRAIRLNMLLNPLGAHPKLSNTFLTTTLGYFANLGLPRMGEVVRAASLSQYERIPVEKIMGAVVVDRLMDVLCIILITFLAIVLEGGPIIAFFTREAQFEFSWEKIIAIGLYGLVILTVIGSLGYFMRQRLQKNKLVIRLRNMAFGFWQGINTVRSLKRPGLFLALSANIWVMFFVMTLFCFEAFQPTADLSWRSGLTVFVFGSWGVVVPSPGGMGTFHFMAQQALGIYGISGDDGFSWANISFFAVNIATNIVFGLTSLLLLPILNRNYHPKISEQA
jgi:uncharacterized protein (TIRG00374 family)